MKIIIAHNYSDFSYARASKLLAHSLADKGNQVHFISHEPRIEKPFRPSTGLTVSGWSQKRPAGLKALQESLSLIHQFKPDVVLAHNAAINPLLSAAKIAGVRKRIFYYHSAHDATIIDSKYTPTIQKFIRQRKRFIYMLATEAIAVSEFAARDLNYYFGYPLAKTNRIHNGLDLELFKRYNTDLSHAQALAAIQFAYLGRLDPAKGVPELIAAFRELINTVEVPVQLTIAGSGRLQEEVAETCMHEENINFIGKISHVDVPGFIRRHHFILVPTKAEAFGMVNIEAMASGSIPIASATGGIPEIIDDGINGFLVPGVGGSDWLSVMKYAINHFSSIEDHKRIADCGRKKVEKEFNMEKQVECLCKLILNNDTA